MDDELNYELLADVAQVIMGQSPPSSTYNTVGEGLPFYQGKTDFGDMYPTPRVYCTEPSRIAEAGDILISVRAPVGPTNVSQERSCIGRGISAIRVGKNLDRDFLLYFLRFYEPELAKAGTGSTFTAIAREDLETIKISFPSLTEQKRIASLLRRADRLRQLRRTAHDLGDALLQSVFLEMFGDPVINPKHFQVELFGNLGDGKYGIVDGPFGSSVDTSVDYISDGEIPVIRSKNIRPLAFDESDLKFMSREKFKTVERSKVSPGDILLVKVGATIGDTCIFPDKYKEAVLSTTGSCRITPNQKLINPVFFLQQLYLLKPRLQKMSSEAVQPFLNMTTVKEIQLLLPPLSLQEEFAGVVARVENLRGRMAEAGRQVNGLFEGLLSESFGGE